MKPKRIIDEDLRRLVAKLPCVACGVASREELDRLKRDLSFEEGRCMRAADPHHVTSRGAGGGDTPENLLPLCRSCHSAWDDPWKGPGWVITRSAGVQAWLVAAERWDVLEQFLPELCPDNKR